MINSPVQLLQNLAYMERKVLFGWGENDTTPQGPRLGKLLIHRNHSSAESSSSSISIPTPESPGRIRTPADSSSIFRTPTPISRPEFSSLARASLGYSRSHL